MFQDYCYYFSSGTEIDHHHLYGPTMGNAFASDRLEFHKICQKLLKEHNYYMANNLLNRTQ
jgi:hypothetical protein